MTTTIKWERGAAGQVAAHLISDDGGHALVHCMIPGGRPRFMARPDAQWDTSVVDAPACNTFAAFKRFVTERFADDKPVQGDNPWKEGGVVTFTLQVTVPAYAANPAFTRDDVIAHATEILSELEDHADSHATITFSKPYEVTRVTTRDGDDSEAGRANLASATILLAVAGVLATGAGQVIAHAANMLGRI